MTSTFAAGDKVLLIDGKERRYLITLTEGGEFHSHTGVVPHVEIVGAEEGIDLPNLAGLAASPRSGRRSRTSCSRCREGRR